MARPDTIVLIHGLWMTPRSWEHWAERYEEHGLQRPRAGLARHGGRGRSAQRRSVADRAPRRRADRRPLRAPHPRARQPADHHGPLVRRTLHAAPARPRPRRRRRRRRPGDRQGRLDLPLSTHPGDRSRRCATRSADQAAPLDREAVPLRVREHPRARRSRTRSTSATTSPAPTDVLREGAFANLHAPRRRRTVDFDNEDRAPLLFIAFENDHIIPPKAARHNAEKYDAEATDGVQGVPGPPALPGRAGLGGGRRLRAGLGHGARDRRRP